MTKNNKLFAIAFAAAACVLTACGNSDDNWDNYDLLPVQLEDSNDWSFIDSKGNVVYEDEFSSEPTVAYNGFFSVHEGSGYALYRAGDKKPQLVKKCDELADVGAFNDGLIPVTFKGKRISVVNDKGEVQFELKPVKGNEITTCAPMFTEGMLVFQTDDYKCGYYNKSGEVAIKPSYDIAGPFADGLAVVATRDNDYNFKYKVIDKKGQTVFSIKNKFNSVNPGFADGYLLAWTDNNYFLIDKKGQEKKISSKAKSVSDYNSKYIIFTNEEYKTGVMTLEGEIVIKPKYESIQFVGNDKFLAAYDDKVQLLDSKAEEINKFRFSSVANLHQFGFMGLKKGTGSLLNADGEKKTDLQFDDFSVKTDRGPLRSDYSK